MPDRIWLLTISHRHGDNKYACTTAKRAGAVLDNYVDEWWKREFPDIPMPDNPTIATEQYFQLMQERGRDEDYTIEDLELVA